MLQEKSEQEAKDIKEEELVKKRFQTNKEKLKNKHEPFG